MKTDRRSAGIEGAGVCANHPLSEIRNLQALVLKVALDKLRHGPSKEQGAGFGILAESLFVVLLIWRFIQPKVAGALRTQGIAEAAQHIVHRSPTFHVARREGAHFVGAPIVVIPELNAGAIEEGHEEAIDCGCPCKAAPRQVEFFHDQRMQKSCEIRARRHAHAREWLFDGAGPADAQAALNDKDALAGPRKISGAGEAVVSGAEYDGVPGFRGDFAKWERQSDFTQHVGGWGTHIGSNYHWTGLSRAAQC